MIDQLFQVWLEYLRARDDVGAYLVARQILTLIENGKPRPDWLPRQEAHFLAWCDTCEIPFDRSEVS